MCHTALGQLDQASEARSRVDRTGTGMRQTAILDYLRHCADKYGLREHIRFGCEARGAKYDEARGLWSVSYGDADGREQCLVSNALVTAVGQLNRPSIPDLKGLETFGGIITHTAVIGFVIDASANSASVRIAFFASTSARPWASKCTTLPLRATIADAPAILPS